MSIVVLCNMISRESGGAKAAIEIASSLKRRGWPVQLLQWRPTILPPAIRSAIYDTGLSMADVGYAFPTTVIQNDFAGHAGHPGRAVMHAYALRGVRQFCMPSAARSAALLRSAWAVIAVGSLTRQKLDFIRAHASVPLVTTHFGSTDVFTRRARHLSSESHNAMSPDRVDPEDAYREHFSRYDAILFSADAHRDESAALFGRPQPRMYVVPPTIEELAVSRLAKGSGPFRADRSPVVVVGSIQARKGQLLALEAFKEVHRTMPSVDLHFVGRPVERAYSDRLLNLAQEYPGRVFFHGHRSDAARFIAHAKVLVQTSVGEGISRVLREAMYLNTPIVATRLSGTQELLEDGSTALLFDQGDASGLASCLGRVLADRCFSDSMARRARERYTTQQSSKSFDEALWRMFDDILGTP